MVKNGRSVLYHLYLRNLLTYTVNNLLQTLNNVKSIQIFAVKQKFNIIYIMCENFKPIHWILFNSLFNLKGSKSEVTLLEFRLKSAFQWGNFNFICHAEQ